MQDLGTRPQGKRESVDRLIRDIEFELAQGIVLTDDLGRAIQAVKQYQNEARSELLGAARIDSRDLAARSFQINDMLITLLEETVGRLQQAQMELRGMRRLGPALPSAVRRNEGVAPARPAPGEVVTDLYERPLAEIETAMRTGELQIDLDVRPSKTPLVGALLTRLRSALHSLPLFYVRRLAGKQAPVNHIYGEWLLHLYRLLCQQQDEIGSLSKQLAQICHEDSADGVDPSTP